MESLDQRYVGDRQKCFAVRMKTALNWVPNEVTNSLC